MSTALLSRSTASLSRRRVAIGLGVTLAVFVGFGLLTDLLPNPVFVRMVPRAPLDYAFLGATSVLAGAYAVQRDLLAETPGDACALGGTVGGVLAFGCPICNHVLLLLLGSSATMTYFDPLRPLIGAVSVALFGGLLVYRQRRVGAG